MGYYVNPEGQSKEEWLEANGTRLKMRPTTHREDNNIVVCHVDNGLMTAVGVVYSAHELEAFTQPTDTRPKTWWHVPLEKLIAVGAVREGIVQ